MIKEMKNLATLRVKNKEDALKYAYAFMKNKQCYIKECSFINPNPIMFDKVHIVPRDAYSASYNEENLPSWERFKTDKVHISSNAYTCIASLDKDDTKRVSFGLIDDVVFFNCFGNYDNEAKRVLENIFLIHASL